MVFATNATIFYHHLSQFDPHHGFDLNLVAPEKRQKLTFSNLHNLGINTPNKFWQAYHPLLNIYISFIV